MAIKHITIPGLLKRYFKKPIFIIIVTIFFICAEIISLVVNYWIYEQKVETVLIKQEQTFSQQIKLVHKNLRHMADLFERFKIEEIPEIKLLIYQALQNPKKREQLHYQLYNLLKEDYEYMHSFGLRQLHFHLPGPISFLRFHRPEKYGDSLVNIREDLMYVNKTKKPLSVFSEGRIFNGFRNVYPLFKDNIFIGTVEISYSFRAMQERLFQVDPDSAYAFLMKGDIVGKKVFQDEKRNYLPSILDGWLYDKGPLKEKMILQVSQMEQFNSKLKKKLLSTMQSGKKGSFLVSKYNRFFIITLLPVKNIKNKVVAYVQEYKLSLLVKALHLNMRYSTVFLTALVLLLTFLISFFVANYLQTKEAAVYDLLTGIFNRRQFDTFFEHHLSQSKRYEKPLSLIFFDIDHFKRVNDRFGHDVGDKVLKELTEVVKNNIRHSDIFARWGGEEFTILLPHTSLSEAAELAEKLRKIIESHEFPLPQKITCSFGVVRVNFLDDAQNTLKHVDNALYEAKESGRNKTIVKN